MSSIAQRWSLISPSSDGSDAPDFQSNGASFDLRGGTFLGIVDAGAPDPAQPVHLGEQFDLDATLNVVGALELDGAADSGINVNGPIHVQAGAQLAMSQQVAFTQTVDLAGGSLILDHQTGARSTVRFDAPGANVTVTDTAFSSLVVQDFQAGDTITVTGVSDEIPFTNVVGSEWQLGGLLRIDFQGQMTPGATYTAAVNANGDTVITTSAQPTAPLAFVDANTGIAGVHGMTAPGDGAPDYLQSAYLTVNDESGAMATAAANALIGGGSGMKAIQVTNGQNVLDGGTGSAFITGGSGNDTFFADLRGADPLWDTLVNFHAGDALTIWGWDPATNTMTIDSMAGQPGSEGATLRLLDASGAVKASVTFAGMTADQVGSLQLSTGDQQAGSYLYVFNQGA